MSGGPENTFRCTLGGVRAREGTKIMKEKEKKEKEKSKSKSEGACSEREGEWRGEGGGGGGGEGAGERESEAREKRDLGKKCVRVEANLGRSAAGLLAWTTPCIWEKQAAKRGQGHGKAGRKFSGNS